MTTPWLQPVTLAGAHVTLEPLAQSHRADLVEAASKGELYKIWYTTIPEPGKVGEVIAGFLADQAAGKRLPFAVTDMASGKAVGITTYMNVDATNRRLEIGNTWYAKAVQRSPLNTEAKRLLLTHAFESLNCIAVEFRTHAFNHQSRRAIERLGAKQDGVLRNHMITPNGTLRDTYVFSIIANEWPTVKAHLTWQLERPRD